MSKRAEERALELFPVDMQMCIDNTGEPYEVDVNEPRRKYVAFGYEQAEKETIDSACKWLFSHLPILVDYYNEDIHEKADRSEFIKLFRKSMEDEKESNQ